MQGSTSPVEREIVLLGGGHAHLQVLRRFLMQPLPGVRVTLVSRDDYAPYTGMLPGYLAGNYTFAESHIDLRRYCQRTATRFIHCAASDIDLVQKKIVVSDRPPIRFDVLSINVGSRPTLADVQIDTQNASPVKPVDALLRALQRAEEGFEQSGRTFNVVVVGAGAGGLEVALALRHRHRGHRNLVISVVSDSDETLPGHASAVRSTMQDALASNGIHLHAGHPVTRVDDTAVHFAGRDSIACDFAIIATHADAHSWLQRTDLQLDENGFICISQTLQSTSHEFVFAAGDTACFTPHRLLKNGVHAVRQGPVLADNLRRFVRGDALRPYRPQRRTLAIVSTGKQHGVASYGKLAFAGNWVWRFKNWLDQRWMKKFQQLPDMSSDEADPMRCGGCGAKVPADILADALDTLDVTPQANVLRGLGAPDDAAVLVPEPGRLLVQSVDQFRSFIDDPYLFGRIAVAHALSDIYAMGARPDTAMAIATLPYASAETMREELSQLMAGVQRALGESNTTLIGGHSGEGAELMFGLSINGSVTEDELLLKSGLREGQGLVLTKPLGTGAVLAAHMRGEADGEHVADAIESMLLNHAAAAEVFKTHGARACTDVTGFGLLGHLGEMLRASEAHAQLQVATVPVLRGAMEYMAQGIYSTLHPANKAAAASLADKSIDTPPHQILCDPQTSGGLLASVPESAVEDCVNDLHGAGHVGAACIGKVCEGPVGRVTLI